MLFTLKIKLFQKLLGLCMSNVHDSFICNGPNFCVNTRNIISNFFEQFIIYNDVRNTETN